MSKFIFQIFMIFALTSCVRTPPTQTPTTAEPERCPEVGAESTEVEIKTVPIANPEPIEEYPFSEEQVTNILSRYSFGFFSAGQRRTIMGWKFSTSLNGELLDDCYKTRVVAEETEMSDTYRLNEVVIIKMQTDTEICLALPGHQERCRGVENVGVFRGMNIYYLPPEGKGVEKVTDLLRSIYAREAFSQNPDLYEGCPTKGYLLLQ